MNSHTRRLIIVMLAVLPAFSLLLMPICAQDKREWGSGLGDLLDTSDDSTPVYKLSGGFSVEQGTRNGTLSITLDLKKGWHASPLEVGKDQLPTRLNVKPDDRFKLVGPFLPDRQPKKRINELGQNVEEFEDQVIWSAPVEIAEGTDVNSIEMVVEVSGQVCEQKCLQFDPKDSTVRARFTKFTKSVGAWFSEHGTFKGRLDKAVVKPGERLTLTFIADLKPGWHIYGHEKFKREGTTPQPTIFVFTTTSGFQISPPVASEEPIRKETGLKQESFYFFHEDEVQWTIDVLPPDDLQAGKYFLEGKILFQLCTDSNCDPPTGLDFKVPVVIGSQTVNNQVEVALAINQTDRDEVDAMSRKFWADLEKDQVSVAGIQPMELASYLLLAFGAGLILNAMPCVLPVIGLKVMSFAQQAGKNRGRILLLNVVFSLGLLTVFWILATLSAFFGFGWGDWLTKSMTGSIIITSVVFAFGLSMLGVWELPIPGMSGSGTMSKKSGEDGLAGACFLGILTTVLATPCTGPLLIPAVTFTAGQPPWVAYLIFTTIGLGMALPYLLVGMFPSLVSWLPRPGAWMNTFKQITGFILLATVVFLLGSFVGEPRNEYLLSMLTLLLAIALGCWWIGRTSLAAETSDQLRAWGTASVMIGLGAWLGFALFGPPEFELDWQPFSQVALEKLQADEKLVFIDFTGPGCLTCQINESLVLNTKNNKSFFEEIGVVAMRADKGVIPVEVEVKLTELGNPKQAIPFYAVYGPGLSEPITFEGPITPSQVSSAIEAAKGTAASSQIADATPLEWQPLSLGTPVKLQTE